ncbi:NAD(P)/FAD-dependent oxidoreductase [Fuscibacter oryzae]|uniref:FAD-dependent oxidoreductase n=1 Tax=Fuscibacter oryzae TaxID=2803939 RepID=A0A8J7SUF9_9RHOB|nr:FAD-dependent oxidoreductase [Fuscibacter oryzae]MBL4929570.1 FAD-dependent oxidoreductase [Fuscibacter oryzae]
MARVDLTVRGGGVFGLTVAFEAARRGAKVRLIETAQIGAGSSGGLVGALSPHVPENWNEKKQFQLESLVMASDFWGAVQETSGLPTGFGRVGRLQPLADDRAATLARARGENAARLWQGMALWQVISATGSPWEPASPSGLLIHDTLSARLHPRMAATALVAAIRQLGGEVVIGNALDEGAVIWAAGLAGLHALTHDLGRPAGDGVKGQALLLRHNAQDLPQLYVDSLHIIPHADGTVAIGSTSENLWTDATATDARLEEILARARAALPCLQDAPVLERWAGVRPRAKSKAPILGQWPGKPGHFVANGGFKIGFGMAPKVAQVMADLVLNGKDAIPEGFRL